MELERRKTEGKRGGEGFKNDKNTTGNKGDLGSGKRMDKDLDKTRIQMAILYV